MNIVMRWENWLEVLRLCSQMFRFSKSRHRLFILSKGKVKKHRKDLWDVFLGALCVVLKMFWKEAIVLATFVMILVWMYTKVYCLLKRCFNVWKFVLGNVLNMCCDVFLKIARMFASFDQVTKSCLPYFTQRSFLYVFNPFWQCCFTIVFGKQPCVLLNGTCTGHRMDHDSNCAKYL